LGFGPCLGFKSGQWIKRLLSSRGHWSLRAVSFPALPASRDYIRVDWFYKHLGEMRIRTALKSQALSYSPARQFADAA
jgi:hypothetical protein